MVKMLVQVSAVFLVSTIGLQVWQTSAQDPGQDHFNLMVNGVQSIAKELAAIYNALCGPKDCPCSQDICQPLLKDSTSSCFDKQVPESNLYNCSEFRKEMVGESANLCSSIRVATSRSSVSYVRSAPNTRATGAQQSAICRTQQLDPVFQSISNGTPSYTLYYVGMIDGSSRTFPATEESGSACLSYDSRKRPWYSGAISHPNHLVILIDCGNAMGGDSEPGKLDSRLDASKQLALSVMETVYRNNYVNVFSFGANESDTFKHSTLVNFDKQNPGNHPELEDLKDQIRSLSTAASNTSPSQFATGLNTSLRAFIETPDFHPPKGLLNVIIFTDGSFTDGTFSTDPSVVGALDQIQSNNVHLFIYGINSGTSGVGLDSLSNEVNAIYRDVTDFDNPLFTMQSYFGYLAVSHGNLYGNDPFWSPSYKDNISNEFVTVTMPVFTYNGSFVGVAAIDVILDDLKQDVKSKFQDLVRVQLNKQDATSKEASNQNTSALPGIFDDSSCQYNQGPSLLCTAPEVNADEDLRDRKCCNSCGGGDDSKTWIWVVVGSVLGAAVLATIAGFIYWRMRKPKEPYAGVRRRTLERAINSNRRWAQPL